MDGVVICTPEYAAILGIGGELLVVGAPEATFKMQYIKLNQTYDLLGYPGISSQQAHRAANLSLQPTRDASGRVRSPVSLVARHLVGADGIPLDLLEVEVKLELGLAPLDLCKLGQWLCGAAKEPPPVGDVGLPPVVHVQVELAQVVYGRWQAQLEGCLMRSNDMK